MIDQASFLGISLHNQRRRRALVIGYCVVLVLLFALATYRHQFVGMALVAQTLTIGGLFGGIRSGGPVKPYGGSYAPQAVPSGIQELNLSGSRTLAAFHPLDEREIAERDHAHYIAYRILRWSMCALAFVFLFFVDVRPDLLARNAPNLLYFIALFILSLPQSVILWTEQDPLPDAELSLVGSAPRSP